MLVTDGGRTYPPLRHRSLPHSRDAVRYTRVPIFGEDKKPSDPPKADAPKRPSLARRLYNGALYAFLALELVVGGRYLANRTVDFKDSFDRERQLVQRSQNVMPLSDAELQWPDNTKILASTLQEENAFVYFNFPSGMLYSAELVSQLANPDVKSVEDAHNRMAQGVRNPLRFFNGVVQVPVASSNTVNAWNKSDHTRQRYVLMLVGPGEDGTLNPHSKDYQEKLAQKAQFEKIFRQQAQDLKGALKSQFEVPDDHIQILDQPTSDQVQSAMVWLQQQQQAHPNSEVLIYVAGHGNAFPVTNDPAKSAQQGSFEGFFGLNSKELMTETHMKRLFKLYLSQFKGAVLIMDPCRSGAFVSL